MSAMFLDRPHRSYKGDAIWTDICWDVSDIPKTWLVTKFSLVMDSVPFPERWYTFIPTEMDSSFVGNYFAAGFGAKSLEEHKEVISSLTSMHKRDRFSFSHIVVIDARIEVIGPNFPPNEPAPFLVDHEILSGQRIHRLAEDGPNDEHYLDNAKKNASGSVISEYLHIGYRKYKYFKCREESMKPDLYLRYCKCKDHSVNKRMSYFDMMQVVHDHHIKWLLYQREIPRECYMSLRSTYQNDLLLEKRKEDRMVKILLKKMAKFERQMYQVGEPTPDWHDLVFKDQMMSIYSEHQTWLQDQDSLSHIIHCRWSKVYKEDPFIPEDTKISFNNIINYKFGKYLQEIHDQPPSLTKKAAHRYWIQKIPVVKPEMSPLVPFDCW